MRFIHTADWHLGKTLKNAPLIDEQDYILNGEFLKLVESEKIQAVIIAGDIYDRSVPPVDAINLLDEIICKLTEKNIFVLAISGNHDNGARLNFGSRLMTRAKFFITGKVEENPAPVILSDDFGEIYFSLIPFISAEGEIKNYITQIQKNIPANVRSVAIAHLFTIGGEICESERKFLGGVENVDKNIFSAYNYTALGHLHKPQTMKNTDFIVRYSGSPLKYSFDEANHDKGVTIVDIDGAGKVEFEHIKLSPRRDVRVVTGELAEIKKLPKTEDYIHANLTDKKYLLNAMDSLRENMPNILSLKFTSIEEAAESTAGKKFSGGEKIIDQFAEFFKSKSGEEFNDDYRNAMEKFLSEIASKD